MSLDTRRTQQLFLRCVCAIFLMAFSSLYLQIRGLYGPNGVLPAFHLWKNSKESMAQCFEKHVSLVCVAPNLGLSTHHTMEFIALLGALLSSLGLVFSSFCVTGLFFLITSGYASLYSFGQTFLNFQWDVLLIETGWLCVVCAPMGLKSSSSHGPLRFWLIRWLLFRLMFASGVVKLQSLCPEWWGLTALPLHFESQCIPTPIAWYAYQLPLWLHRLAVVVTFVIEIPVPFFFFSPVRGHRLIAFYSQVLLQVMIILSGNYNFFNLLTITLCLSLLDDKHLGYGGVRHLSHGFIDFLKEFMNKIGYWLPIIVLSCFTIKYFALTINTEDLIVESRLIMSKSEFQSFMENAVPVTIAMGCISLTIAAIEAVACAAFASKSCLAKVWSLIITVVSCAVVVFFFAVSLVPYSSLDAHTSRNLAPSLVRAYMGVQKYHVAASYGLFRRMTGVGGRPEVIIEGANAIDGPWIEYEFPYKPGSIDRSPPIVVPHQPRLDWQLWFAALGSYNHNPWLMSLAYRLLTNSKEVARMLDSNSAWRNKAPKYIRAKKYLYYFAPYDTQNPNWWWRKLHEDYFPIFSADHKPLLQYLEQVGVLAGKDPHRCSNRMLCSLLDRLYSLHCNIDPALLLWSLLLSLMLIIFTRKKLSV